MKIAFLMVTGGIVDRGAEVGTSMLAEDLVSLGHEVDYYQAGSGNKQYQIKKITLPLSPDARKSRSIIGKILERLYLDKKGVLTLLFSLKCLPHLLKGKYDILFPVDGIWEILACKLVKLVRGGKIVVSGKAGIGWTDADNLNLKPDVFVPISEPATAWAKKSFPKQKIQYIPEQIDTKVFHPTTKPVRINLKHPIILTIAAFTKYKRVDAVIKAVANLNQASLLLVGEGEEELKLKKLAEELLPHRHQFIKAGYKDLPSVYTAADVFTLASQSQEAFGRVLIEALACGLPVVTATDPLRESILGSVGIYTEPTDSVRFAKDLESAITHPRLPSAYRNQALQYDRLQIAKQYQTLFISLLKVKGT